MFIGFGKKQTDPTNCQIWFAIQFTTNPLDGGDFKRLCHGRTKRFVPALAATKRNLNTIRFRGCLGVRRTLRHQLPPVSRSWSKTAVHKLGGSVRMLRPRTRPYPAIPTLVRNGRNACYILFVRCLWCDVVRGRSTEREGGGEPQRWVGKSSRTNRINELDRRYM